MSLLVLATKWLTSITLPIRPSTSYDLVTLTDYSHLHCVSLTLFKFQFLCVSQSSVCYVLWLPVVIFRLIHSCYSSLSWFFCLWIILFCTWFVLFALSSINVYTCICFQSLIYRILHDILFLNLLNMCIFHQPSNIKYINHILSYK